MKILLVANGFLPTAFGGVEIYVHNLAKALQARGHEVAVFCRESDHSSPDYQILEDEVDGIPVSRVVNDFKRIRKLEDTFTNSTIDAIFERALNKHSPDVVHINHLIGLSARLPFVVSEQGVPSVFTLHDYWQFCQRVHLRDWRGESCLGPLQGGDCYRCVFGDATRDSWRSNALRLAKAVIPRSVRRRIRPFLSRQIVQPVALPASRSVFDKRLQLFREAALSVDRLLVPSDFVRNVFSRNGYPGDRLEVVPLGIRPPQVPEHRPLRSDQINFAFVGSVIPWKGVDVLINAFKRVRSGRVRLTIYGREDVEPAYSNSLRRLASKDKRIVFKGPFPPNRRDQIFEQLDVLVIPSVGPESFSIVAREALLSGKPVIASAVGALTEVVAHGTNGYLVRPNDEEDLADVMSKIAQDSAALSRLELPGPVQVLTVDEHVKRIQEIYASLT